MAPTRYHPSAAFDEAIQRLRAMRRAQARPALLIGLVILVSFPGLVLGFELFRAFSAGQVVRCDVKQGGTKVVTTWLVLTLSSGVHVHLDWSDLPPSLRTGPGPVGHTLEKRRFELSYRIDGIDIGMRRESVVIFWLGVAEGAIFLMMGAASALGVLKDPH